MSSPVNEPRIEIIGDRIRLHIDLTGGTNTKPELSRQTTLFRPKTGTIQHSKLKQFYKSTEEKSTSNQEQVKKSSQNYFGATKFYRNREKRDWVAQEKSSRPATARFPSNTVKNELYRFHSQRPVYIRSYESQNVNTSNAEFWSKIKSQRYARF